LFPDGYVAGTALPERALKCTLGHMTLTAEQAERLHRALAEKLGYLTRLKARMERVGFRRNDPLFQRVQRAHDALHDLTIAVHYLACKK
jgi:hypothetical protein